MQTTTDNAPLLMVTVGGGGWHGQTRRILEQFRPDEFRYTYVCGHHSGNVSTLRLSMPHPGDRVTMHCLGQTRQHPIRYISNPLRFAWSFVEAWRLIRRVKPDAVLSVANSTAIPLFLAARVRGICCVFVESLTRTQRLSRTGRLIHRLRLASQLLVQWPEIAERHARLRFAGAVI